MSGTLFVSHGRDGTLLALGERGVPFSVRACLERGAGRGPSRLVIEVSDTLYADLILHCGFPSVDRVEDERIAALEGKLQLLREEVFALIRRLSV